MEYFAYKITRDYGFAPNPFYGLCSLACCKPHIRERASIGDWVIGTGSVENKLLHHLIFLMQVTEKISFEQYWNDPRFRAKRPVLNGSLKQIHGDNIYFRDDEGWHQVDSHHSHPNGMVNVLNLNQDLISENVLLSNKYVYLGDAAINMAPEYLELTPGRRQRNYITIENKNLAQKFVTEILSRYPYKINGTPINWTEYNQLRLFTTS
jgi:hypothetical protein